MEKAQKKPQVSILALLLSFANILGVLYVTALPDLTQYFQVTKAAAQETISYYLAGGVLAQFVYPSVAKALGRKPTIYIGCSLAILGSVLCLIAVEMNSFSLLLFGRALTAFGAACGAILTSIIVTDAFSIAETKKNLSYLMSFFIVLPSLGVVIGGLVTEYLSWQSCFYFMLLYSVFVTGLCILLPETAKEKSVEHLHVARIAKSYFRQFSNPTAVLYGLITACACIILYVFSAEAPFIARNQLNLSPAHFGLYNLIPNFGFFVGGLLSAFLSHKFLSKTLVFFGILGFFLFSGLMWILFDIGFINTLVLFGMPALIFFAASAILPNGQTCALAASEDKPYASSMLYILQYSWIILSICVLRLFPPQNASTLPIVYFCSGVFMIVLWFWIRFRPQNKN